MYALLLCGRWGLLTYSLYGLGPKWFEIAFMFITQTHPKKQWDSHALRVWFMELASWDTSSLHGHTSFCFFVCVCGCVEAVDLLRCWHLKNIGKKPFSVPIFSGDFHFSPYILFLPLLIPILKNASRFGPRRYIRNRKN